MNTVKTSPKDFFIQLGATVVLYTAAVSLINLAFAVINYFQPDTLAGYFSSYSIAWPVSMLIVLVPILYVLEWLTARDIAKIPEKADIWIRRWRIYLTLFLTGATMIGDLIVLLNTYLNGEITTRLIYKVIVLLIIVGVIFKYYLLEIWKSFPHAALWQKLHAIGAIVIVVAVIVLGFIAVGSPATQRALRFDADRTNDLSTMQWQVINYWQQKGKLPAVLTDMNDSLSGFTVPVDPETNAVYEYTIKGNTSFELCATFARKSVDTKGRGVYGGISPSYDTSYPMQPGSDSWAHEAGHACFQRTIDPDKYPVTPKSLMRAI